MVAVSFRALVPESNRRTVRGGAGAFVRAGMR